MDYCQWNPIWVQAGRLLFQIELLVNILGPWANLSSLRLQIQCLLQAGSNSVALRIFKEQICIFFH